MLHLPLTVSLLNCSLIEVKVYAERDLRLAVGESGWTGAEDGDPKSWQIPLLQELSLRWQPILPRVAI